MALKKQNRIPRSLFPHILQKGKPYQSQHIALRVVSGETPAFSVVVSKKVARSAVERNKIRRRMYSLLTVCVQKKVPFHGVILMKKGANTLSFDDLKKEFSNLMVSICK